MENVRKTTKYKRQLPLYLMLLPGFILVLIFSYGSMVGIIMAFQNFIPGVGWYVFGSPMVGLKNFEQLIHLPNIGQVIYNTIFIAVAKILSGNLFSILIALLLNEVRKLYFKRFIQTVVFFPYFISWVIMSGIIINLFNPTFGAISSIASVFHMKLPLLLGDANAFPWILIFSNMWKDSGYGIIVYLAAITSVDTSLYEAATIDGAGYFKKAIHITIPGIMPIIILLGVLSMGNVLNAGFDQVFNLYSPLVYKTGDILDTFVFRLGISQGQYSLSTAVGLFKSVVSFSFISVAYYIAYKCWNYRIF